MKRTLRAVSGYLALLIVVFGLGAALAIIPGCASTPQGVAYQATGTTRIGVYGAMELWGAYVKAVKPPVAQEAAVKDAFEKWQASMVAVCDAGQVWSLATSTNAIPAQDKFEAAVAAAGQARGDVINLITKFGVKLP